jgi:hypothetical protein
MSIRKLRDLDGSGGVTLPREDLEEEGLADGGDLAIGEEYVKVEKEGPGEWTVRRLDV